MKSSPAEKVKLRENCRALVSEYVQIAGKKNKKLNSYLTTFTEVHINESTLSQLRLIESSLKGLLEERLAKESCRALVAEYVQVAGGQHREVNSRLAKLTKAHVGESNLEQLQHRERILKQWLESTRPHENPGELEGRA